MGKFLRFARRVFVSTSLLLSIATMMLWVRSCSTGDSFDRYRENVAGPGTYHDTRGVFSTRGTIGVGYLRMLPPHVQDWPADEGWKRRAMPAQPVAWPHRWALLGFGYWNAALPTGPGGGGMRMTGVKIPHWFVAWVFMLPPAGWARRAWLARRARRRLASQLCVACGYDVRASTEHCPECGTPVPSPAAERHLPVPSSSGIRLG